MREHNRKMIELLIQDLETTKGSVVALNEAARWGLVKHVQRLLDSGVDVNSRGDDGSMPLMFAASGGSAKCIELLLNRGALVNAVDDNSKTALISAMSALHREPTALKCVKLLLDAGANINVADNDGMSPFDYAAQRYSEKVYDLLRPDQPST